jgi:hypothetical protein
MKLIRSSIKDDKMRSIIVLIPRRAQGVSFYTFLDPSILLIDSTVLILFQ